MSHERSTFDLGYSPEIPNREDQECPSGLDPRFAAMACVWECCDTPLSLVC